MAFPSTITAAQFSRLLFSTAAVPAAPLTSTNLSALFVTAADVHEVPDIRDMPSFGQPANIVKVPVYGQAQTQSVGAQADAPDLELVINYVPSKWDPSGNLRNKVGDGISKVFMFSFLTARPATTLYTVGGLGSAPNANIFFVGRMESLLINPARDDAATANISMSIQSDFYGPTTI
jgi:hypothetical protein